MLERGEYVLNRNAVSAVGMDNLHAINFGAAPRFAKGGSLREPHLSGPAGALTTIGQASIHHAYLAAQHYLDKHRPHRGAGGVGGINLAGIHGSVAVQFAAVLKRLGAPRLAALALYEAGLDESGMGATAPGNVLQATGFPAQSAASEAEGFLTGRHWTGVSAIALARKNPALPAYAIAQMVQKSGAGEASGGAANYGAQRGPAEALMRRYGYAEGGPIGTAKNAVAWAMNNRGRGPQWGNPQGGWCGLFIGADMAAQHLPHNPGGNAAWAANWAEYGVGVARANALPGDIADYGTHHVGMYVGGGRQINGDWRGKVELSSFPAPASSVGPLTALRRPPYHGQAGERAARQSNEHVAAQLHGKGFNIVGSGRIQFGSLPTTVAGCRAEIRQRIEQKAEYKRALAAEKGAARADVQANLNLINHRLFALKRTLTELLIGERAKLPHSLGNKLHIGTILKAERAYTTANEYATQVVALEPTEGNINAYITGKEEPAYMAVLGAEAKWRNAILGAEFEAKGRQLGFESQLNTIKANRRDDPKSYKKNAYKIPALEAAIEAINEQWNWRTETGSLAEALEGVQGPSVNGATNGSRTIGAAIGSVPVAGKWGGDIFQTQETMRQLGLKVHEGEKAKREENEGLLREALTFANQRNLISSTLAGVKAPYAGAYAAGGIVSDRTILAGERGPEVITVPLGSRVRNASETSSALSPSVTVNNYHHEGRTDTEVWVNGKQVEANINNKSRKSARGAGRGLAVAGKF